MVGPISVRKPELLPPDFEQFVSDSGGHGFVMVSFGSYVESVIHKDKLEMLARAFGKLKQKVLWRLKAGELKCSLVLRYPPPSAASKRHLGIRSPS